MYKMALRSLICEIIDINDFKGKLTAAHAGAILNLTVIYQLQY